MCGIVGAITEKGRLGPARAEKVARCLEHRGPDDQGIETITLRDELDLTLIHRRLSIIDLTESGRQPMKDGQLDHLQRGDL